MKKEIRDAFLVQFKWTVLRYAKVCRTDAKAYRDFDVPKPTRFDPYFFLDSYVKIKK